ncbi:MAG: hypothetical protein NT098_04195 [Candidatus Parcubacteria bacterium]|nr:hypothetical protein [Candidatus Parcubacteria bacterium]
MNKAKQNEAYEEVIDVRDFLELKKNDDGERIPWSEVDITGDEKIALEKGRENFKKGNFLTINDVRSKLKISK